MPWACVSAHRHARTNNCNLKSLRRKCMIEKMWPQGLVSADSWLFLELCKFYTHINSSLSCPLPACLCIALNCAKPPRSPPRHQVARDTVEGWNESNLAPLSSKKPALSKATTLRHLSPAQISCSSSQRTYLSPVFQLPPFLQSDDPLQRSWMFLYGSVKCEPEAKKGSV